MAKKISGNKNKSGIVYSTNPDFAVEIDPGNEAPEPKPAEQLIRIRLETRHRAGKIVTMIENFIASESKKEELSKKLKSFVRNWWFSKE